MQVSLINTVIPFSSLGPFSLGFLESKARPCCSYPEKYVNETHAYIFVYEHILFFMERNTVHRGFSTFETSRARLYFEYLSFVHFISFCFMIFPKLHRASSQPQSLILFVQKEENSIMKRNSICAFSTFLNSEYRYEVEYSNSSLLTLNYEFFLYKINLYVNLLLYNFVTAMRKRNLV